MTTRLVDQCFTEIHGVAHYQLRQLTLDSAELGLMLDPKKTLSQADLDKLQARLEKLLDAKIQPNVLTLIAPEDSGKFRLTVPCTA